MDVFQRISYDRDDGDIYYSYDCNGESDGGKNNESYLKYIFIMMIMVKA